jgi:hypothetical protein
MLELKPDEKSEEFLSEETLVSKGLEVLQFNKYSNKYSAFGQKDGFGSGSPFI